MGVVGTWVKSCWCFLPSVGKHPFYGLHMPSKPLQLPKLCMYIVNVLPPSTFLIIAIIDAQCGDLRHQRPQDSSFSTLPNFVFHAARILRLLPPELGGWPSWNCDQCGKFIERALISWVLLGVTEYIDSSLYGDHRDHGDHGNNWWLLAGCVYWPDGDQM